ncbi:MAG: hypothetical protein JXB45_05345, partial [Candidatus Krumholzibacteriota bacterium]|nr:hypothetical protein [Candidatus Krumholzibacteriota bacterium]
MVIIKSVSCRKILNSHVKFTNEFIIELKDGRRGSGGAPQGETISLYEDRGDSADSRNIIQAVERDMCKGISVDQEGFDAYLQERIPMFGRNNAYALSLAFFSASGGREEGAGTGGGETGAGIFPSICLNILNGGNHAYTNPVLSDFPEYLLVSRSHDPEK